MVGRFFNNKRATDRPWEENMNGRFCCTMKSAIALMVLVWAAPMAQAQAKAVFDLPAQPLADSLRAVGSQTNVNLLFDPPLVAGKKAPALKAEVTADEALTRLLAGTGIKHEFLNETTIVLAKAGAVGSKSSREGVSPSAASGEPGKDDPKEGNKSPDSFRVAQVDQGKGSQSPAVANQTANSPENSNGLSVGLSEIIVTAQKKSERLQDVPVPVTAIDGAVLASTNQVRVQDFFSSVPGLSVSPVPGLGTSQVAIRGVTTGGLANPTVGIVVDDVPYGSTSLWGNGFAAPDLDPSDISRVEVLRGPQGALYGASSMGGLIKYVTVDPSTEQLSGNVQAGGVNVHNSPNLGYLFRAAVNVPISDTLAVRGSVFAREDPGYLDNIRNGQRGVNEAQAEGGRVAALWRPSDSFSVKLSALIQDYHADGDSFAEVGTGLGDLQQNAIPGTGWKSLKDQAYSATIAGKVGNVDLTSMTGYNIVNQHTSFDFSASSFFGPEVQNLYGVSGAPLLTDSQTKRFTQEFRLSMPMGSHFDGLVGLFYSDEKSNLFQAVDAADQTTGNVIAEYFAFDVPTSLREYSVFADLTWKVTDRFDIQFGGRESKYKQTVVEYYTGAPYNTLVTGSGAPFVKNALDADDNAFTYLVTPRFRLSPDWMLYARAASGYRIGGANPSPGAQQPAFKPDKTDNYEIGTKGDLFSNQLTLDASLYYINWKDIQLQLRDPNTGVVAYTNASGAKSKGIELSSEWRPFRGSSVAAWVVWNDAVLSAAIPPASINPLGASGDRLPNTSRFSGHFSLGQEFPLTGKLTGAVGAAVSYVGVRESTFLVGSTDRQVFPAYTQTDLNAALNYDTWRLSLFANNITDKRGVLSGGTGSLVPTEFYYIQPRTVGLTLAKQF